MDYPKLGVWPDGYYVSYNRLNGNTPVGSRVCAFDRATMLLNDSLVTPKPPQCQYLNYVAPDNTNMSLLPADLDGTTLPPQDDSPAYFMNILDASHLNLWRLKVDWTTPQILYFNSKTISVDGFSEPCPLSPNNCIPQKGGGTHLLDAVGDRLMYRLAYRNFVDHEALVTNHTVVDQVTGYVGIRWYELRKYPGSDWSVYQRGTYIPDSDFRWMGSIAMDNGGNIALGYSVSGGLTYPSIRYTGRLSTDALHTMESETTIPVFVGGNYQNSTNRWGDYSSMSIDPVDDCTFWYTQEYMSALSAYWHTGIASFKFPTCGAATYQLTTSFSPAYGTVIPNCSATCSVNSGLWELTAVPNNGNILYSWGGDCWGANALINLNVNAPKTCTANFVSCGTQPVMVMINASPYYSVQNAYNNASDTNTLHILGTTLTESPNLNRPISITLDGGYNCAFTGKGSYSFMQGTLSISNGTATVNNLVIR